jgi:hypothetical protein
MFKAVCGSGMFIPAPNFSIPDPDRDFLLTLDPIKKDTGSRIRIRNTAIVQFQERDILHFALIQSQMRDYVRCVLFYCTFPDVRFLHVRMPETLL